MKNLGNNVSALAAIVIGALLILMKGDVISIAMTIAGVACIIFGILDILNKKTTSGLTKLVAGVLVLVLGWVIVDIALTVVGVILIIVGAVGLLEVFKKKASKAKRGKKLLKNVLYLLIGALLVFNLGGVIDWTFIVAGVLLIVEGITMLFDGK